MNAKKEKFENILSQNLPNLETNPSRIEDKELINIQINNSETNKKPKKKKNSKNSPPIKKPKKAEKNIEEFPKQKKTDKNKILKAYKRLDIQNLLNSDTFAEKFAYQPSHNEIMKLNIDSNYNMECPYSTMFYDNILLRDESIFFIHDKTQKGKFMDKADIEKIKTENIQLNFGKDPSLLYLEILKSNTNKQNQAFELQNLQEKLCAFSIFHCKVPNYIKINMENFAENELMSLRDNYFNGVEQSESLNSTRFNSGTSKTSNNFQLEENDFLLNNEINKEIKDDSEIKYLNKKRIFK
jgi:hypothetical protein